MIFILRLLKFAVFSHLEMILPEKLQKILIRKRFLNTIKNTFENIPYYRLKFKEAGLSLDDIKDVEDIKKLPFLTKEDVRKSFPEEIISEKVDMERCHKSATTGSTGRSLPFVFSENTYAYYITTSLRVYTLIGMKPWDKIAYVKYTSIELPSFGPFFRTFHIPSRESTKKQIELLMDSGANILTGYASIIYEIAKEMDEQSLKTIKLKFISLNSEMSTKDQRSFISNVFNCPVYDEYSTEETWMIASHCKNGNYHIFADNIILEFLDKDGKDAKPGDKAEIVITTLRSDAMPFIRYRIGDIGVLSDESCPCRCRFPLLSSFEGRSDDAFILPDGRVLSSLKLLNTFTIYIKKYLHLMEEFKLIQEDLNSVLLLLVKGKEYCEEDMNELLSSIKKLLGDGVDLDVEFRDKIEFQGIKRKAIESYVEKSRLSFSVS